MESEPMTKGQGDRIIRLLEKILDELEEINDNTSNIGAIETSVSSMQRDVRDIAFKD